MDPSVESLVTGPYTRVFVKQRDSGYSAHVRELPGVFAGGEHFEECNTELEAAMEDWIASELAVGHTIPEPLGDASTVQIDLWTGEVEQLAGDGAPGQRPERFGSGQQGERSGSAVGG